ncbi:uncharacterized protein B0H18DRAFT_959902 [Fomitopsis serialis]|uniref:uncharacterized protein n=1 Tax=Fomitopsis serialis TaxID=139415 RepID=UPI0020081F21|nr:uncharacterized protein B0H18DRAFT_959902 [Neoantrodia serialis]KAH9914314.1 hypothetical protein B0H18DRAFT_959902 [Neoantrodia serialis]
MEELASNASDDSKTRMARIKADDPRVFKSGWYSASPPPGMSHLIPIVDVATTPASSQSVAVPSMAQSASPTVGGPLQATTTSVTRQAVSFELPDVSRVGMDENACTEPGGRPSARPTPPNVEGGSTMPHWECLKESDNEEDGAAYLTDTSEEVDELEERVITTAGKAKGTHRAETTHSGDNDGYGPRVGHESYQGIELFETAADVSCEVHELRQENAKLHVMYEQLREDFEALRQRFPAHGKGE